MCIYVYIYINIFINLICYQFNLFFCFPFSMLLFFSFELIKECLQQAFLQKRMGDFEGSF